MVKPNAEYGIAPRSHDADGTKRRALDDAKLALVKDVHVRMALRLQAAFGRRRTCTPRAVGGETAHRRRGADADLAGTRALCRGSDYAEPPARPIGRSGTGGTAYRHNLQRFQEGEQFIRWTEPPTVVCHGTGSRQGALLQRDVRVDVHLGGFHTLVPQPERNDGAVDAIVQKLHGGGVPQHVRRDALVRQRGARLCSAGRVFAHDAFHGVPAQRCSPRGREQRIVRAVSVLVDPAAQGLAAVRRSGVARCPRQLDYAASFRRIRPSP